MKKPPLLLTLGLVLLLSSLTGLLWLDLPLRNGERLTFTTAVNDTLAATYHPGTTDVGVLLLPGFGSDQHMLRSLTRELVRRDVPVLTIDYSGHGRAPGALTFDNAETDRLAGQVQAAMETLQEKSGLPADQIHWIGHSLGARVAVQSSVLGPTRPGGLILYGAQINLGTNAQSEFFTGTADSDLAWVQSLGQQTPPVPILLLSGAWEDILPVEAAQLLMTQLCGTAETACDGPLAREWRLYPRLVHNYEIYAPRLIADTIAELGLRNAERSGAGCGLGCGRGRPSVSSRPCLPCCKSFRQR
jgi:pimeloyl-ACP methyl ester carboxylesterase